MYQPQGKLRPFYMKPVVPFFMAIILAAATQQATALDSAALQNKTALVVDSVDEVDTCAAVLATFAYQAEQSPGSMSPEAESKMGQMLVAWVLVAADMHQLNEKDYASDYLMDNAEDASKLSSLTRMHYFKYCVGRSEDVAKKAGIDLNKPLKSVVDRQNQQNGQ